MKLTPRHWFWGSAAITALVLALALPAAHQKPPAPRGGIKTAATSAQTMASPLSSPAPVPTIAALTPNTATPPAAAAAATTATAAPSTLPPPTPASAPANLPPPAQLQTDAGGFAYEETLPHETGVPKGPHRQRSPDGKIRIAIIFDDLGLNRPMTQAAMALPAPLTLSFLPYAGDLKAQVAQGARNGHTILLHMPMQPLGRDNPGPGALTVDLDRAAIKARVNAALDAVPGAIGLNNHMGSRFSEDADGLKAVFEVLAARHLAFIDSRTTPKTLAYSLALAAGLPTAKRDVFLDDVIERAPIDAQLNRLVAIARKNGSAIAIGHPYPPTIAALKDWLPKLKAMGIDQVSVSELLQKAPAAAANQNKATKDNAGTVKPPSPSAISPGSP